MDALTRNLSLEAASARIVATADARRFLHDDKAAALQVPDDPTGRYPGRERLGMMHALFAAKAEGKSDALGENATLGRLEVVIGHLRTIAEE